MVKKFRGQKWFVYSKRRLLTWHIWEFLQVWPGSFPIFRAGLVHVQKLSCWNSTLSTTDVGGEPETEIPVGMILSTTPKVQSPKYKSPKYSCKPDYRMQQRHFLSAVNWPSSDHYFHTHTSGGSSADEVERIREKSILVIWWGFIWI